MGRTYSQALTDNPLEVDRYRNFTEMIARGQSQTQACKTARISSATAAKLLRDPDVLDYLQKIRSELEQDLKISRQDVLRGFLHAIRQADLQSDPKVQVMGWTEVGKMEGFYAPQKHEHEHHGTIEHIEREVETMSTPELEQMLASGEVLEGEFEEVPDEAG